MSQPNSTGTDVLKHGNYRTMNFREAIAEAQERDELLVGLDEVLWRCPGSEAVEAIHIVADPHFWTQDEPKAYSVQLVRPRWAYGSEGHLSPIRFVAVVDDFTDAELDELDKDDSPLEHLPYNHMWCWAIPRGDWQRCEIPWWKPFRDLAARFT